MFKFIATLALICTSQASFAANECRKVFITELTECIQEIGQMRPKLRHQAIKACVKSARADRLACKNEPAPNACQVTCQSNYDANVVSCEQAYDPIVCGGDTACEAAYVQLRADCITQSSVILNSCTATCPL